MCLGQELCVLCSIPSISMGCGASAPVTASAPGGKVQHKIQQDGLPLDWLTVKTMNVDHEMYPENSTYEQIIEFNEEKLVHGVGVGAVPRTLLKPAAHCVEWKAFHCICGLVMALNCTVAHEDTAIAELSGCWCTYRGRVNLFVSSSVFFPGQTKGDVWLFKKC